MSFSAISRLSFRPVVLSGYFSNSPGRIQRAMTGRRRPSPAETYRAA